VKPLIQVIALSALSVFLPTQVAAESTPHKHITLLRSETLTYAEVFEGALNKAPEAITRQSREQQAIAYQGLAKSWTAGSPRVSLNYLGDNLFDNAGMQEFETGLEWQLWSGEGRRSNQKLGQAYQRQFVAWQDYLQLLISGRVRTALADISQSQMLVNKAEGAREEARKLVDIAQLRLQAGDAPRDALLQAQTLLLARESGLLAANAELVDAQRNYINLTGLSTRPAFDLREERSALEEISPDHPVLRFLQSGVDIASNQVAQTKEEARGKPSLNLGLNRQRGGRSEDYSDALVLGFSLPFGTSASASAQTSDARRDLAEAQMQYESAMRQLRQTLHEVEHELAVTQTAIKLSKEQVSLTRQRSQMAHKAFELGEITMARVVQILQQQQLADTEYQLLQLKQQRLVGEFNQSVGVLP
jgi:outer membrane protein TolC